MVARFVKKTASANSFHWAEPIIADELCLLYKKMQLEEEDETTPLLEQHFRMWHCALQKKEKEAESLHKALVSKAADFGITEQSIASINESVIKLLASLHRGVRYAQ